MDKRECGYIKCDNWWDADKYPTRKWCRAKHQTYQWRLDNPERYKNAQKRYMSGLRSGVVEVYK